MYIDGAWSDTYWLPNSINGTSKYQMIDLSGLVSDISVKCGFLFASIDYQCLREWSELAVKSLYPTIYLHLDIYIFHINN